MADPMRLSEMAGIRTPDEDDEHRESIWPLNAVLLLLGAAILGVAFTFLDPTETRPQYNPWTYAIVIPIALMVLSVLLSTLVSQVVEKSMQVAFLLSMLIHLLLIVCALNVVIFSRMWPDMLDSLAQQRIQLKRETLQAKQYHRISNRAQSGQRPDYLRPVETQHQPTEVEPVAAPLLALSRNVRDNLVSPSPKVELSHTPHLLERHQPAATTASSSQQAASLSRSESSAPRVRSAGPSQPLSELEPTSQPAALAPAELAPAAVGLSRSADRQSPALTSPAALMAQRVPPPSPRALATPALVSPRDLQQQLAPSAQPPSTSDSAMRIPRSTAGGTLGAASPSSLPVRGVEDIGSTTAAPSQQPVIGSAAAPTRRSSSARPRTSQLPDLGAPQSPSLSPVQSLSSGLSGRSPTDLLRSADDGAAAATDVVGLTGSQRELARSSIASGGQPPASSIPSLDDQLSLAQTGGAAQAGDTHIATPAPPAQAASRAALARRGAGSAAATPAAPATLLDIPQAIGSGGLANTAGQVGALLNRRDAARDDWAPPQLESQRFARQDVGGPLAAGQQVALPAPAFQQRLDRLTDRNPQDEISLEPQTELAIERGLEFLAKHQRADGSWRLQDFDTPVLMRSDTAATGLALLSFQGAGYTHNQFKYASTVRKAIEFLVAHQQSNGDLYIPQDPSSDQNAWLYSHGIASLALCEAVGMTQDDALRPAAQRAIDFMVASQDPKHGGWRYRPGSGADTSVTGWFMLALKSGQLAGLNVPQPTFDNIRQYVDASQATQEQSHLYRYNPFAADTIQQRHGLQPTAVMTSVGLLMRLYFGWQRERPEMMAGADYLLDHLPDNGTVEATRRDTYYWYYATQVMYHMRGPTWQQWHDRLYPLLIDSQVVDGEWAGSWAPNEPTPDLWARYGGRLYVTTLNLLSLEVSYRHLPLYEATNQ